MNVAVTRGETNTLTVNLKKREKRIRAGFNFVRGDNEITLLNEKFEESLEKIHADNHLTISSITVINERFDEQLTRLGYLIVDEKTEKTIEEIEAEAAQKQTDIISAIAHLFESDISTDFTKDGVPTITAIQKQGIEAVIITGA